jgi:hypothetical protein
MFSKHVSKELSAYCHGEVTSAESRAIAEHLIGCSRCRLEFEEIKLGVKLAERLPQISAPDSLWFDLQHRLMDKANILTSRQQSAISFRAWRPGLAGAVAVLLLVAGFGVVWLYKRESRPFWEVARLNGAPTIGSSRIDEKGRLAVGQWLETDGESRAKIQVGSIGQVEVDPNTRIRLVETKPTEHRLELARGKLSARIWAPPHLFFVDTPAAVATDLGCAYTLEVDDEGQGLLHVTSGWVALQLKDHESMVPEGATCAMRPGVGPGTPYFDDSSAIFRRALAKFDFEPQDTNWSKIPTLDLLLMDARPRDTLTLWHVLRRVDGDGRARVYDRMAALVPPPAGVTREGVLRLNEEMLQLWKQKLETAWSGESVGGARKPLVDVSTRVLGKS